jgi:hypothetical protein
VRQISVVQGSSSRAIGAEDRLLCEGFHAFEPKENIRWTDGDAHLPVELLDGFDLPVQLTVRLGCTTQYPDYGTVPAEYSRSKSHQLYPAI